MKLSNRLLKLLLAFTLVVVSCSKKEKQNIYDAVESEISCLSDPTWFPHSQTPAPKEGKDSPFVNGETVTNLDFYKWSWQKFLWLTKPVVFQKKFNIMDGGVSKELIINDTLPLFLIKEKIRPIDDTMDPLTLRGVANVILIYDQQACSNEVLRTNPAYNEFDDSYKILYSLHTSPIMMDAANNFINEMNTGKLDSIKNTATFPVGSLELKVSWVDAKVLPKNELSNYYTTIGAVSNDNGKTFHNTEVAMLGMHVVGVVENHPEFVWATFQHKDLTVPYNWKKKEASSSTEKLLFKSGSTTGVNGVLYPFQSRVPNQYEAYELFEYGVPLNKDGSYMTTSQNEPSNIDNIKDINKCVSDNLKDVFKNYFCNGAVWLDTEDYATTKEQGELIVSLGYAIASAKPKSGKDLGLLRGSTNCANATMETFTQTFESSLDSINVSNIANCFSCHSAASFKNSNIQSPLYLSHIFDGKVQKDKGSTDAQIEAMKNKQALLHFIDNQ